MNPSKAKGIALRAVNRMEPLLRRGYRIHEFDTRVIYAPYIPLVVTDILFSVRGREAFSARLAARRKARRESRQS